MEFLTISLVMLSLGISAVVFVISKLVLALNLKEKQEKIWKDIVLPILPLILGALFGAIFDYSYPDIINTTSLQIMYGSIAGLLSSTIFRLIKSTLKELIKNKVN